MLKPVDVSALPKSIQNRPEVRALTLQVYPGDGPKHFRVPGRTDIYNVYFFGGKYHCNCTAASSGRICAHSLAAKRYRENQENT